jgi:hypothetical protein
MRTHRIVHLRDWHFVPKDLFAIDMKNAHGRELADDEINRLYEEHLLEVEAVQLEQMSLLRCLIRHHGLRTIHCEGLTPHDLPNYYEKIAVLRDMEKNEVPHLRAQLQEVRDLKAAMAGKGEAGSERYEKTVAIEKEVAALLDQHQGRLREVGAAGRLLIAGEIETVLPLDESELLEQAKPITPDGKVVLDQGKVDARHDGQVKLALRNGTFALVVLGGSHDLSKSVRKTSDACEYIRITTKRYKQVSLE